MLRLIIAINAILYGAQAFLVSDGTPVTARVVELAAIGIGAALLVGLLTPIVSIFAIFGYVGLGLSSFVADSNTHFAAFTSFDLAGVAIALVFLGPGAFSLDARLFGRREIIIPESRRPPF